MKNGRLILLSLLIFTACSNPFLQEARGKGGISSPVRENPGDSNPGSNNNPGRGSPAPTDPTVTWPTAATILQGQALSTSALSGGSAEDSTGADVTGTFAWTDGTIIPTPANGGYSVTFTPDDAANYNSLTGVVDITVIPTGKNTIIYYWTDGNGSISITDHNGDELQSNTVTVKEDESITFTAGGSGYSDWVWTLNSKTVGDTSTYIFIANDKQNTKNYIIGLMMKNSSGKPHYTQITVYIEEN